MSSQPPSATPFSSLPVHPALAPALAKHGYADATPVQAAVLGPELVGHDLLVSSQTGSGKTVAFGTLIAQALLGTPRKSGQQKQPRALVVTPTRELATQVCRELTWLFAETRTRLSSFTGGTPMSPDMRRLHTGLDIAVGTPGRLVDLHDRGALDLTTIEVLVLDEADEMLDLGFKDDLEHLLAAAPATRRTLLFSATIPRAIERLAAKYSRDPKRVDPRAGNAREQHDDIRYVAHLVRPHDRLAAVVNVLGAAGDAKAIVFCRTREGVGTLHQRLVDHGFRATAIAGDRAQGERDRALEALRSGRARVLVATNVAARGLDLPDVDLVLHADLPENPDSLTHRSGRTGRAGKKGTSVVIASLPERGKAERLMAGARVLVRWTLPPTQADVRKAAHGRLAKELIDEALAQDGRGAKVDDLVDQLRAALPEQALLTLLLRREDSRLPGGLPISSMDRAPDTRRGDTRRGDGDRRDAPRAERGPSPEVPPGRYDWKRPSIFRINLGAKAKAEPGWLLPLICRRGGITRKEVGAIRIGTSSSTFEIAREAAEAFTAAALQSDPREPHVLIEAIHGTQPVGKTGGPRPGGKKPPFRRGPKR